VNEFELIARFFTHPTRERQGVGDDCARIDVADRSLALTTDMLVEGVHFLPGTDPAALGHKALAVNLSDLAAAGARPRCFLLALALPRAEVAWLEAFSGAMLALAREHGCDLVGGDTTRSQARGAPAGAHTIAITAIGELALGGGRGRSGARPGDEVWVSGMPGEASLALAALRGEVALSPQVLERCRARLDRPQPRVALGLALNGIATAAIDVSDGFLGDLAHVLGRSGVGATVQWESFPRSPAFAQVDIARQQSCILAGGDDYELVFTAPATAQGDVLEAARRAGVRVAMVGVIEAAPGLRIRDGEGRDIGATLAAFDHFR
jgi:thiamine-monophosphate kinase